MNIFTKTDGTFSLANTLNFLVLVVSVAAAIMPIWQALIPENVLPYIVGGIATINVVVRVLSNGAAITGASELKEKLGVSK